MTSVLLRIAVIFAFIAFVSLVLVFLPDSSLPVGVSAGIALIVGYGYQFDFLFPMDTLIQVLVASLFFHGAVFIWRIVKYLIRLASAIV